MINQLVPKLNSSVRKLSLSFALSSNFPSFLSLKPAVVRDNIPVMVMMDQNLDDDFYESGVNVDIPTNTNNEGEKSNKCNQCEYASSVKSSLRSHLREYNLLAVKQQLPIKWAHK